MTTRKAVTHTLVLLTLASHLSGIGAVCMNPKTWVSGYKVPLALEAREAEAIVIGRVVSEQSLQEDQADPYGTTAYNVSIKVLARLKGNLPNVFVIRNENTSSRYPMSVDEEHILFVNHFGNALGIDACGNSAQRADAPHLVRQIRQELQTRVMPLSN